MLKQVQHDIKPHAIHFTHDTHSKKAAFTLAEVLIALGIIGVVAAMTIPTLIQKTTNLIVETKLKKIYSVMNQAIMLSELDNGPKEKWPADCDGNCKTYYEKYLFPYLKKNYIEKFNSYGGENWAIYLTDGSVLVGKQTFDFFYYPNGKNFDIENFYQQIENDTDANKYKRETVGSSSFAFRFRPQDNSEHNKFHYQRGFEPYKAALNVSANNELTEENLRNGYYGCNSTNNVKSYCTALIQLNNWKIPKNYPVKIKN